jgi:hypothetical protein
MIKPLELNVDFQRVCLCCALEDVVCLLYFVEGEIYEEGRSESQLECPSSAPGEARR